MGAARVLAEARRPGLEPCSGHRAQSLGRAAAPDRHELDRVGLLADTAAVPVALVPPFDPGTGAPLDLSGARLAAVDPDHVEQLVGDGVSASLTIMMTIDDQPWGTVVCHHHDGAWRPSHEARVGGGVPHPGGSAPHRPSGACRCP